MMKYEGFPVVMLDIYGRERHPEATNNPDWVVESYTERRQRLDLMLYTFQYVADGIPPANRILLIDEENEVHLRVGPYSTLVTHMYGGLAQGGFIVDLNGRIISAQKWERLAMMDEVLSNLFGLEQTF